LFKELLFEHFVLKIIAQTWRAMYSTSAMSAAQAQTLKILTEELARIRMKNPGYSLRAFARRLKLPVSALSGILSGNLPITRKNGEKILENLHVAPPMAEKILQGLRLRSDSPSPYTSRVLKSQRRYSLLDMDHFQTISEWQYFAVLSLATTKGWKSEPAWIASRLGIQIRQAKEVLIRLERLDLLARDDSGRLMPTGKQYRTSSGVPNTFLRRHHVQGLDLARRAMEEDEFDACDFSSMTMAIDPRKLPEAKHRITEFRRSLCQFLEADERTEVYRICLQLFPLSARANSNQAKNRKDDDQ
jgi:uncharacterized protein (TIGR02147 family)